MISQLLGSPLQLFLALLPVFLLGAYVLRNSQAPLVPAQATALVVMSLAVAGHLYFAFAYLLSPGFTDHIEPNTASVAWIWANGGQIYHDIGAAERYAFLYGPLAYIVTGSIYKVLGASALTAKIAGIACLVAALGMLAAAVRRQLPGLVYPVVIALGYFSLLALFFKNFSFWSKPDSFMIAASAAGLLSCFVRRLRLAWALCGLAIGLAASAKITGVIYFLPYVAWMYERDGIRAPFAAGMAALLVMIFPYMNESTVSLSNYISWLHAAGGHGLNRVLFIQNLFFLIFSLIPAVLFLSRRRALLLDYKYVSLASVAALLLILVAASKPGSGPHHFLPFLPALGFFAAMSVYDVITNDDSSTGRYFFWTPVGAVLVAAAVKASLALYYGVRVVNSQFAADELVNELDAVIERYPESNIYMGYGDGSRYTTTFVRNHLVYRGYPYLVDASAIMDFQLSGIEIPATTINRMVGDTDGVWLIPAGQPPFTLLSWYFRHTGGMVFDADFRDAFNANFVKTDATMHYDIYMQPQDEAPTE